MLDMQIQWSHRGRMHHFLPGPMDLTPQQILDLRALDPTSLDCRFGVPVNLTDLCDTALGHRFPPAERRAALTELARVYENVGRTLTEADPLTRLLVEVATWAEGRLFDDDQDPATDSPEERIVRAYQNWRACR
jgi:hypothetical protein